MAKVDGLTDDQARTALLGSSPLTTAAGIVKHLRYVERWWFAQVVAGAEILGDDPAAARAIAARRWDRTPGTAAPVQLANQLGMVFSRLDCTPRWRERLPEIEIPTLVVHGRRDPFFPVGCGEALARDIPGARLLVLAEAATAIPDATAGEVAEAMLALG